MLLSNTNQQNTDGDRIGEMCEDDADRDGIYSDNTTASDADNCPSVSDPTNNPGYCSIDLADFVMFKTQNNDSGHANGSCMDHWWIQWSYGRWGECYIMARLLIG